MELHPAGSKQPHRRNPNASPAKIRRLAVLASPGKLPQLLPFWPLISLLTSLGNSSLLTEETLFRNSKAHRKCTIELRRVVPNLLLLTLTIGRLLGQSEVNVASRAYTFVPKVREHREEKKIIRKVTRTIMMRTRHSKRSPSTYTFKLIRLDLLPVYVVNKLVLEVAADFNPVLADPCHLSHPFQCSKTHLHNSPN